MLCKYTLLTKCYRLWLWLLGAVYTRVAAAGPAGSEAHQEREETGSAGLREWQEVESASNILSTTVSRRQRSRHVSITYQRQVCCSLLKVAGLVVLALVASCKRDYQCSSLEVCWYEWQYLRSCCSVCHWRQLLCIHCYNCLNNGIMTQWALYTDCNSRYGEQDPQTILNCTTPCILLSSLSGHFCCCFFIRLSLCTITPKFWLDFRETWCAGRYICSLLQVIIPDPRNSLLEGWKLWSELWPVDSLVLSLRVVFTVIEGTVVSGCWLIDRCLTAITFLKVWTH